MNKNLLMTFVLILCLLSCIKKDKIQEGIVQKTISSKNLIKLTPSVLKQINLSSIVNDIKIIALQTNKESLLAEISKIEYDDSFYFIQNSQDKLIYVFDSIGNFSHRIGSKGTGPGEVQHPERFALHKNKKELWLVNNFSDLFKYDYSGKFKEKEPFKMFYNDFIILNNNNIYFHTSKLINYSQNGKNHHCFNLWIKTDNTKECFFPYSYEVFPNGSMYFETRTPFSVFNDSITYHYAMNDTIYSIIENKVSPKYIIDFGSKKSSLDFSTTPGKNILDYIKTNSNDAFYVQNVLENADFLMFNYLMSQQRYKVLYSKKSNRLMEGFLVNDITGSDIEFIYTHGNTFIGYIEPGKFTKSEKSNLFINSNQMNLLENIDEENNPVLIVCEFKDF